MKYFLIIIAFITCCLEVHAQIFPVQVNTQIIPPYSPYLADYTVPGAQKLMVNILLKDATLPEYQAKLRITIEGVGITIRTKATYVPQPLMLPGGGIPLLLYGEDIAEYFDPNNLDFAGITRSQYQKGAKLPEGVYRFTIEVLDFNRGTVVSNKGTTVAWIILNDPPLLNFPKRDTKIQIIDPTNIAFSWTPRHTASPNAAFTTEYIFKLVEIWPANRNPFDAILTQPPLYEITTNYSQIIYGPAEPALLPGRKYAWQVQARDEEGRDLFKNQGKSEVFVFQFGDPLGIPEKLRLQTANSSSLTVRWDQPVAGSEVITYRVRYRPAGNAGGPWYEDTTEGQLRTIISLQPETEYQIQVRAEQSTQMTEYSPVKVFKTKPAGADDFVCSSNVQPPPQPSGTQPLFRLGINDTIRAGGYDVVVRKANGSNGTYTGEGVAIVPWFNSAKVRVTFDKINVNDQSWLTNGIIKSFWNPDSKFLLKPETKPGNQVTPDVGETSVNIAETEMLIHIESGLVVSVTQNEDGEVVVETSSGETQVVPKGKSASIIDDAGNGYVVDKEGNIAKTTAAAALEAYNKGQREYNMQLQFAKGNGQFGFDEKKLDALAQYYQQLEDGSFIPWKAVSPSEYDVVDALLGGTGIEKDKIRFEVDGTTITPKQSSDDKFTFSLLGRVQGTEEEFVAYYQQSETDEQKVIGKLNLTSYDKITKNVVIVPVNMDMPPGLSTATIKSGLDEIYRQAVAYWQVTTANRLNITLSQLFDDGESGLLTNYTPDMKKVITAYGTLEDNTYYLFLIDRPKSGADALGYMPRSKQAGFIFTANHRYEASRIIRTMAHELGHGAFNLKHTFSEFPGLSSKGSTFDNLMDYPAGSTLYKYQWDYVHDPQKVIPLFEDDEDSRNVITNSVPVALMNPDETFNFITPTGKKITLPKNCVADFRYGIINPDYHNFPIGYLNSFKIREDNKEIHYVASYSGSQFRGYYSVETQKFYIDNLTAKNTLSTVIMLVPDVTGIRYISYTVDNIEPYKNDEARKTFWNFPVQPYLNGVENKSSDLIPYSQIGGIVANENEQWTLHSETFSELLEPYSQKPEHYYLLKIVELATAYDGVFRKFSECWDDWETLTRYNDDGTGFCSGFWETNFLSKDPVLKSKWKEKPVEYYKALLEQLLIYIESNRMVSELIWKEDLAVGYKQAANKQRFTLDLLVSTRFLNNEAMENVVSCKNRAAAIAILNTDASEPYEQEIIRLLSYVPDSQIDCFLEELRGTASITDEKVIVSLNSNIHDTHLWQGEDNYKALNKAIWKLVLRSPKYTAEYYKTVLDDKKSNVHFYDASFWTRVKQTLTAGPNYGIYCVLAESVVNLTDDGAIELSQANVIYGFNWDSGTTTTWDDPFTLVSITNNTRLSMLRDIGNGSSGTVMPALMLEYMDWKGAEEFNADALNAFLDIASTASGIGNLGHLRHLTKLQRAAVLLELTADVSSIAGGLFAEQLQDNPTLQTTINLIQFASGAVSLRQAFKKSDVNSMVSMVNDAATTNNVAKVIDALNEIEKQADVLRSISSKANAGFLQKIEIYAFLKKIRTDAKASEANQALLDQIARIESKAGSIDNLFLDIAKLSGDPLAVLRQSLKSKGLNDAVLARIEGWDVDALGRLDKDIPTIKDALNRNPELVAIWKKADEIGIDAKLKSNSNFLEKVFSLPCK